MAGLSLSSALSLSLSPRAVSIPSETVLTREANGNVTIQSLGPVWSPTLKRQPDGTVEVA